MLSTLRRLRFAWRDWRDRVARRREHIGPATLVWNPRGLIYIRAWRQWVLELIRTELARQPRALELWFDDDPPPGHRALRVGFQYEHAVVRPGGGDSAGAPPSRTPLPDGRGVYVARVLQRDMLERCALVVDYSHINRAHLQAAGGFDHFLQRCIVLAPLLYAPDFRQRPRRHALLTLCSDATRGRRGQFLREARAAGLALRNVRRCFEPAALRALLLDTRILVNLRQSEDHHTLEELRILPALLCGVVVVCEDAPLRHTLPYAPYIVWATRDQLVATVAAVAADYAQWWQRIFTDPQLPQVLTQMEETHRSTLAHALDRLARICNELPVPAPHTTVDEVQIEVCICTWQRPGGLQALLQALALQQGAPRFRILLADNHAQPVAHTEALTLARQLQLDLHYLHAPARNIAVARNACLDAARAPLLAFIDDDESPPPEWLATLWRAQQDTGAAVLLGPVQAVYPPHTPAWLRTGDFHSKRLRIDATGRCRHGHTANVLVTRACIGALRFDTQLGRTGGEDTLWFARLQDRGVALLACPAAEVTETVDPARLSLGWLCRRARGSGQAYARVCRQRGRSRIALTLRAAIKAVICLLAVLLCGLHPVAWRRWWIRAHLHLGVVQHALGGAELILYGEENVATSTTPTAPSAAAD